MPRGFDSSRSKLYKKAHEVKFGDWVKETESYHRVCMDREVRGQVVKIKFHLATVRNPEGWEYSLHKEWLELDPNHPSNFYEGQSYLTHNVSGKKNYCPNCGEKL